MREVRGEQSITTELAALLPTDKETEAQKEMDLPQVIPWMDLQDCFGHQDTKLDSRNPGGRQRPPPGPELKC